MVSKIETNERASDLQSCENLRTVVCLLSAVLSSIGRVRLKREQPTSSDEGLISFSLRASAVLEGGAGDGVVTSAQLSCATLPSVTS